MEGIRADEPCGGVGRAYELMQCSSSRGRGHELFSCVAAWRVCTYELMHGGRWQCEVGVRADVVAELIN